MKEFVVKNTGRWESKNLPVGSYFIVHNSPNNDIQIGNHIMLKVYGEGYINILDGTTSWGSHTNFKECELISDIKISLK